MQRTFGPIWSPLVQTPIKRVCCTEIEKAVHVAAFFICGRVLHLPC